MMLLTTKKFSSLFLLTSLFSRVHGQGQKCTPCEGEVDPTLSFDGVPCDYWISVAGHNEAGSAQCAFDRMVGIWFCGCPVPQGVAEICTVCTDGSQDFNQTKKFPDSNITCDDVSEVPAIDGERTCRELNQMSAFCECPWVEPTPSTEKCSMCPNGTAPSNPERVFLTTGETCQQVIDTIDLSPIADCEAFVPDLMVDYQSYCGCPESKPPSQCSLCPEGSQLADPDYPISYVPGSTCADFDNYTKYIDDPVLCEYMHQAIAIQCCAGLDLGQVTQGDDAIVQEEVCSFCPDGKDVLVPDRHLIGSNTTCGDLQNRPDEGNCTDRFKTEFDSFMHTQIYCVCPGSQRTESCNFCPAGQELLYPENLIVNGVQVSNSTCAEYAAMADSTFDDNVCAAMQSIGTMNPCCGVPNANVTMQDYNMTMCSLCPNNEFLQHADRLFLGTSVSCKTYYDEMKSVPKGEMCDDIFADFEATFDPQIYCGCPSAEPPGTCSLCPGGSMSDPNIWISDIFTTCGQMDHIAQATSDQAFCESIQKVGQYYCCFSPGNESGGNSTRHLRSSSNDKELAATTTSGAASLSPYHFSAIKSMNIIQKKVANVVDKKIGPI